MGSVRSFTEHDHVPVNNITTVLGFNPPTTMGSNWTGKKIPAVLDTFLPGRFVLVQNSVITGSFVGESRP